MTAGIPSFYDASARTSMNAGQRSISNPAPGMGIWFRASIPLACAQDLDCACIGQTVHILQSGVNQSEKLTDGILAGVMQLIIFWAARFDVEFHWANPAIADFNRSELVDRVGLVIGHLMGMIHAAKCDIYAVSAACFPGNPDNSLGRCILRHQGILRLSTTEAVLYAEKRHYIKVLLHHRCPKTGLARFMLMNYGHIYDLI